MGLFGSHHVRILHNSFRRQRRGSGIHVVDSNHNLIKGNRVLAQRRRGILMEGGERNRVRRNRLVRNGAGITLGPGSHNVITRNHVSGGRDGIRIEKGHGNLVADNVVARRPQGGHPPRNHASLHRRRAQHRPRKSGQGQPRGWRSWSMRRTTTACLKRNVASGAGDDGFDIESRSAKLTENRARRNGDLGIAGRARRDRRRREQGERQRRPAPVHAHRV